MKFAALIIAAGYSSRMGEFKPLLPFGDITALGHCVQLFRKVDVTDILVVTGYNNDLVEQEAQKLSVGTVFNPDFADGMFSSICTGIETLHNIDGFFLLPVDIPLIRPVTIETLKDNFTGDDVLIPTFKGEFGHPPLIPGYLKNDILSYDGGGGLQKFLSSYPSTTTPVWDKAILQNMDTKDDYSLLLKLKRAKNYGTREEALEVATMFMPERGVLHGVAVAKIATKIAIAMKCNQEKLDIIHNAGLLHDIGKGYPEHALYGANILEQFGLIDLVATVKEHMDIRYTGKIDEVEIVSIADKMVQCSTLVSIKERFQKKLDQYKDDQDACVAINRRLKRALEVKDVIEKESSQSMQEILS